MSYGEKEWDLFSGNYADYEAVPRPALSWKDDEIFPQTEGGLLLDSDTPQQRFAWACGLTMMRERITELSQARLVIGGRLTGFAGLLPGVLEEARFSLKAGKPLFITGAFGGAAGIVSDLLSGNTRKECTDTWARANISNYNAALALYDQHNVDFCSIEKIGEQIIQLSKKDLAQVLTNGLDEKENLELFNCTSPENIARLILTGLGRLAAL